MGFALQMAKIDNAIIKQKVLEAAKILKLDPAAVADQRR